MICSSDLEVGYGLNLLKRAGDGAADVSAVDRSGSETPEVVQCGGLLANGVIFKSTLGSGHGDLISALQTIAEGEIYYPEPVRRLASSPQKPKERLELVEDLTLGTRGGGPGGRGLRTMRLLMCSASR